MRFALRLDPLQEFSQENSDIFMWLKAPTGQSGDPPPAATPTPFLFEAWLVDKIQIISKKADTAGGYGVVNKTYRQYAVNCVTHLQQGAFGS